MKRLAAVLFFFNLFVPHNVQASSAFPDADSLFDGSRIGISFSEYVRDFRDLSESPVPGPDIPAPASGVSPAFANADSLSGVPNYSGSFTEYVSGFRDLSKFPVPDRYIRAPASGVDPEDIHFWEDLKEGVFDDICKQARIKLKQNAKFGQVAGLGAKFRRYMKQYPDDRIALIDEVGVKFHTGYAFDVLEVPGIGPLQVRMSGRLEGKSIVVRRLENDRYCKELGKLANLLTVKTILPINVKRISAMGNGEIWKMPFLASLDIGVGVGAAFNGIVFVSISAGVSQQRSPSLTLYRKDENTLRVRLRIARIEVKKAGASVGVGIPAGEIGFPEAENVLTRAIDRSIAKELNKYLAMKLGYSRSKTRGKKILLEFLLDPDDRGQIENLVEFLNGDLGIIAKFIKMGLKFDGFSEENDGQSGLDEIEEIENTVSDRIGTGSSFAGANHYHGSSDNSTFRLPIIYSHDTTEGYSYNRYQSLEKKGEVLHVNQISRKSDEGTLDIPFIGYLSKHSHQENAYVINKELLGGEVTSPVLLYQHQEGFVRQSETTARRMVERVNGILKYAGMHGNGTTSEHEIPAVAIFPKSKKGGIFSREKTYKAAILSFKLMFSRRGVQKIIVAPAQAILKAFLNVMKEVHGRIFSRVAEFFRVTEKGEVVYNRSAVMNALGLNYFFGAIQYIAQKATALIKDILSVGNASGWRKQSERLAKLMAGKGKSKIGYGNLLKVIIQLVDKKDISASIYIHTDKRIKGEEDLTLTFNFLNANTSFNDEISEFNSMRERFARPSRLTD